MSESAVLMSGVRFNVHTVQQHECDWSVAQQLNNTAIMEDEISIVFNITFSLGYNYPNLNMFYFTSSSTVFIMLQHHFSAFLAATVD